MKNAYPIVLTPDDYGYLVFVPDFQINTEGKDIAESIMMARDAIGLIGIDMEDDHEELPVPCRIEDVARNSSDIVTLVDVDFDAYRRANETRAIKKNCTVPSWLNEKAEQANINFSAALQRALKAELGLS